MADTEETNQTNQTTQNSILNGSAELSEQNKGFEAEDIVADAIKLNVDDDLNEQRYDNPSEKSSSFQKGNQNNSLDNANIEDEPNYEIDENDAEQYLNEQNAKSGDQQNNESSKLNEIATKDEKSTTDEAGDKSASGDQVKSDNDKTQDGKSIDQTKTNDTATQKDDQSSKDTGCKKEPSTNETDSTSKSKSSSSKDRDRTTDSKGSSSSNDKIVWVSGLSSSAKASDLQTLFKKYGRVVSAKIIKNTKLSGSKLFGVITMENVEQAEKSIQSLNKTEFDGKTITVEKNRLEDKKSTDCKDDSSKDKKDGDKSSSKRHRSRSRSRSPKRRSVSPVRRFPLHRPGFIPRRGHPPFGFRGRGGFGGLRPPFIPSGPPPMLMRKFEVERLMRRREIREKERRREEDDYRRQKDLERRQQEERDKLEREKMKLKFERERLEREKADFLRAEREKARMERERLEREREELRRKQQQLPVASSRLDDSRSGKRYDDLYGSSSSWDLDRKRGFSTAGSSATPLAASTRYDDLEPSSLGGNSFANFSTYNLLSSNADLIDRRKLDVGLGTSSSLRESNRSSSGYDRDDRRQTANGSLGYSSASRSSLSSRDRDSRRDRDDWKSSVDSRRTDSRFMDSKNPLPQPTAAASQSSYLSSTTRSSSGYDRAPDAWSSAPDRMPPASSLSKFTSYQPVSAITDRSRLASSGLPPSVMGSTIGLYNPAPMSGLMSNTNYNNLNNTGHRRY